MHGDSAGGPPPTVLMTDCYNCGTAGMPAMGNMKCISEMFNLHELAGDEQQGVTTQCRDDISALPEDAPREFCKEKFTGHLHYYKETRHLMEIYAEQNALQISTAKAPIVHDGEIRTGGYSSMHACFSVVSNANDHIDAMLTQTELHNGSLQYGERSGLTACSRESEAARQATGQAGGLANGGKTSHFDLSLIHI